MTQPPCDSELVQCFLLSTFNINGRYPSRKSTPVRFGLRGILESSLRHAGLKSRGGNIVPSQNRTEVESYVDGFIHCLSFMQVV